MNPPEERYCPIFRRYGGQRPNLPQDLVVKKVSMRLTSNISAQKRTSVLQGLGCLQARKKRLYAILRRHSALPTISREDKPERTQETSAIFNNLWKTCAEESAEAERVCPDGRWLAVLKVSKAATATREACRACCELRSAA